MHNWVVLIPIFVLFLFILFRLGRGYERMTAVPPSSPSPRVIVVKDPSSPPPSLEPVVVFLTNNFSERVLLELSNIFSSPFSAFGVLEHPRYRIQIISETEEGGKMNRIIELSCPDELKIHKTPKEILDCQIIGILKNVENQEEFVKSVEEYFLGNSFVENVKMSVSRQFAPPEDGDVYIVEDSLAYEDKNGLWIRKWPQVICR